MWAPQKPPCHGANVETPGISWEEEEEAVKEAGLKLDGFAACDLGTARFGRGALDFAVSTRLTPLSQWGHAESSGPWVSRIWHAGGGGSGAASGLLDSSTRLLFGRHQQEQQKQQQQQLPVGGAFRSSRLGTCAGWVGSSIAAAFFSSLERSSCLALSTTDSDGEEELLPTHHRGVLIMDGGRDRDRDLQEAVPAVSGDGMDLVGFERFQRHNPMTDLFKVLRFHHVEFWCGDATNTWRRFGWGLGMHLVAKSDQTTGNQTYCSYVLRSNQLVMAFSAPYSSKVDQSGSQLPHPGYDSQDARRFNVAHGLAVRAVGILVENAANAFLRSVENGAVPVLEPQELVDGASRKRMVMAEVKLYGDVVLRYVSTPDGFAGPFLPNYEAVESLPLTYGLRAVDHAVGNVPSLLKAVKYISSFTGFHEFAEFTAEDVGTADSGLNSMVLASNNECVLLPLNEPTYGTKRKSQIQTYLEHNEGPGLQHLALICDDIFSTLKEMQMRSAVGGFEFMPKPPSTYYRNLPRRVGNLLSAKQIKECEELGILVDKDDQGILLQIFTKPLGDRPTVFIEIIQRIGCMARNEEGKVFQKAGCGGFGKGNFSALFKSIEEYEKTLDGTLKK